MRKLLLIALLPLVGCAGQLRLLEDGKVHHGTYSQASRSVEVTIDGVRYAGGFTQNQTVAFGQGFGTAYSGGRTAFGTGFGTSVASNGSGQAVLTSPDGKVIQCVFQAAMGRGQGQCEALDGRRFVLVIGDMPGDPPSASAQQCNHGVWAKGRCGG